MCDNYELAAIICKLTPNRVAGKDGILSEHNTYVDPSAFLS